MGIEEKYIGTVINNRYKIIKLVGNGGMGDVYLAEHEILKKKVAIKILHFEQSKHKESVDRFKREAIAASNIGQANIVDVTDFGYMDEGNAYFVMEYVNGKSLADVLREKKIIPLEFAVSVASQIALALYAAHEKGIIHRDLKPENILLTENNGIYPFVKIVDFGISKIVQDDVKPEERFKTLTKSGSIFGTPEYMSPEQAGGNNVEPASDIYSLGVIIYEMLTGRLPFYDDNYMKILHKHQYEFPELPSNVNPDIPSDVNSMIMKCLEKNVSNRYHSMLLLFNDLKAIYVKYNLEEKLSLAFLFNSGNIKNIDSSNNGFSGEDIIKILNSSDKKLKHITLEKRPVSKALKIAVTFLVLLLFCLVMYAFIKSKRSPMVVERSEASTKNDQDVLDTSSEKVDDKEETVKKKQPVMHVKKKSPTIKLVVNSNIPGVRVYDRESGKTICNTPCSRKLPKKEAEILILGFEYEDFTIKPMAISLDKDMIVNLNLKNN